MSFNLYVNYTILLATIIGCSFLLAFLNKKFAYLPQAQYNQQSAISNQQSAISNQHLYLDALRGIAASGVIFSHSIFIYFYFISPYWSVQHPLFQAISQTGQSIIISSGDYAVGLFFMITAFLFTNKFAFKDSPINTESFYIKRIARILPMYIVSVFLIFIGYAMFGMDNNLDPIRVLRSILKWSSLGYFYGETLSVKINYELMNIGVFWTLIIECYFYILLPFCAVFFKKVKTALSFILFTFIIANLLFYTQLITLKQYSIYTYFLIGSLAAIIYKTKNKEYEKLLMSPIFAVISLVILVFTFATLKTGYHIIANLSLGLFFILVANNNSFLGLLKFRGFHYLGTISYSMYLLHGILLVIVNGVFFPAGNYLVNTLLSVVLTLLLSSLTFKYVEKPFMDLANRVVGKNR